MDEQTSIAIIRILDAAPRNKCLHISDLVESLKWMLPAVEHDEASVLEHLALMTSSGYVLPIPVTVV